jgi:hypothetical protein
MMYSKVTVCFKPHYDHIAQVISDKTNPIIARDPRR